MFGRDCMNSSLVLCTHPHLMMRLNFREVFKEDFSGFNIPAWQEIRISVMLSTAMCHWTAAGGMNWTTKLCSPEVTVVEDRFFFSLMQQLSYRFSVCTWRVEWLEDGCTVSKQSSECKYLLLIWKRGLVEALNLMVLAGWALVVMAGAVRFFSSYALRYLLVRGAVLSSEMSSLPWYLTL